MALADQRRRWLSALHPARFFEVLQAIDTAAVAERARQPGTDYRPAITLTVAAGCLLLIHYLKLSVSFRAALELLSSLLGEPPAALYNSLSSSPFYGLYSYAWWGFWHLVGYVLIPVLVIRRIFGERVRDYGIGWGELGQHWHWYGLLATPILSLVVLASFRDDFTSYYPFYRQASRSGLDLLLWEAIYLTQFVCLEFFFRGFLLHGCQRAFGANAVLVMCLPYLMIHFSKPWLEATGAWLFGLFLGVLALRSRSIWGGVVVHVTIALSMDLLALIRTQGLPERWWP